MRSRFDVFETDRKQNMTFIESYKHFDLYGLYKDGKLIFRETFKKPIKQTGKRRLGKWD